MRYYLLVALLMLGGCAISQTNSNRTKFIIRGEIAGCKVWSGQEYVEVDCRKIYNALKENPDYNQGVKDFYKYCWIESLSVFKGEVSIQSSGCCRQEDIDDPLCSACIPIKELK